MTTPVTPNQAAEAFNDSRPIGKLFWAELPTHEQERLLAFANALPRIASEQPLPPVVAHETPPDVTQPGLCSTDDRQQPLPLDMQELVERLRRTELVTGPCEGFRDDPPLVEVPPSALQLEAADAIETLLSAVEAERERCAKVVEDYAAEIADFHTVAPSFVRLAAKAIRTDGIKG